MLVRCLRIEAGGDPRSPEGIRWVDAVALADEHKLVPLLARCAELLGAAG